MALDVIARLNNRARSTMPVTGSPRSSRRIFAAICAMESSTW
jgi:hypothetical protein